MLGSSSTTSTRSLPPFSLSIACIVTAPSVRIPPLERCAAAAARRSPRACAAGSPRTRAGCCRPARSRSPTRARRRARGENAARVAHEQVEQLELGACEPDHALADPGGVLAQVELELLELETA